MIVGRPNLSAWHGFLARDGRDGSGGGARLAHLAFDPVVVIPLIFCDAPSQYGLFPSEPGSRALTGPDSLGKT